MTTLPTLLAAIPDEALAQLFTKAQSDHGEHPVYCNYIGAALAAELDRRETGTAATIPDEILEFNTEVVSNCAGMHIANLAWSSLLYATWPSASSETAAFLMKVHARCVSLAAARLRAADSAYQHN